MAEAPSSSAPAAAIMTEQQALEHLDVRGKPYTL